MLFVSLLLNAALIGASPVSIFGRDDSCSVDGGTGVCKSTGDGCDGGTFHAGTGPNWPCPGGDDMQCCIKSTQPSGDSCSVDGGTGVCKSTSDGCSGGTFHPGTGPNWPCSGGDDVQCCIPNSTPPPNPTSTPTPNGGGKLVVYWGAEDDSTTLDDVCGDASYDIVNLAFMDVFFGDGGFPGMTISGLDGPSDAQANAGATSLQDGSSLTAAIQKCQSNGKLVLLSLGGGYGKDTLTSDEQADQIATMVWNLFLGGTDHSDLRPFGAVKLDGVDFNNESHDPTSYPHLVGKFRELTQSDSSKKYYLSAAPQCPYPDESIPLEACTQLDFVTVQHYNNGECNIAQSGFADAVQNWSKGIGNAKLFIGALASDADGDQGYVDAATVAQAIQDVKAMNLPNFGGAMLWEAQLAVKNGNFQQTVKAAL